MMHNPDQVVENMKHNHRKLVSVLFTLVTLATAIPSLGGCVGHRIYNTDREQYLQELTVPENEEISYDLAIIEFDDQGIFWKLEQLEDTLEMIAQRNALLDHPSHKRHLKGPLRYAEPTHERTHHQNHQSQRVVQQRSPDLDGDGSVNLF